LCPGIIKTNLARDFSEKGIVQKTIVQLFQALKGAPPNVGARTLVLATTLQEKDNGKFFAPYKTDAEYTK
jgi:hypothetical protein